jgi:hypothetical protein
MPKTGCDYCIPYAFLNQMIKGIAYCIHCGRELSQDELDIVSQVPAAPSRPNNSFEKGARLDERGLPYLDANGQPIRMKESFNPREYGEGPVVLKGDI